MSRPLPFHQQAVWGCSRARRVEPGPVQLLRGKNASGETAATAQKRGPEAAASEEVLVQIRQMLAEDVFAAEGCRKVWARMRMKGIRVWKERILRLMRKADLLSPNRRPAHRPANPHEGSIVPMEPNRVWGTDGGHHNHRGWKVTIFAAIDAGTDCLGIHMW
ncbi:MAG: IS3 family transposase [Bryobacteraceae bacterium]